MMFVRVCILGMSLWVTATSLFAQDKTIVFVSRYDSESLATSGGLLTKARPFDIFAVTPGRGATAFPLVPATAISTSIGDPDGDGTVSQFTGLPHSSFGITGLMVKHADRKSGDPRRLYWTVRVTTTTPPTLEAYNGNTVHEIRPGDFVRLRENGNLEFFMRQEHFVKAAGPQNIGDWVHGAGTVCQAPNGDLFYSPPNAISQVRKTIAGGHWINNPSHIWCNDGAINMIRAADITYDSRGNVADVAGSSARQVLNEATSGPNGQLSIRQMLVNSGAKDSIGKSTSVTFTMVGLDLDPNGGTFDGYNDTGLPNLIFTFNNTVTNCCGGPFGSWHGTIFSTAKNGTQMGSIARINGVKMGVDGAAATADGVWTGIKQGSGDVSAPVLRGLAWLDAGFGSSAPYGNATLQAANDGTIDFVQDPNVRLALQAPIGGFPAILAVSFGTPQFGRPFSTDLSAVWGGYGSLFLSPPILGLLNVPTSVVGQFSLVEKLPNDPRLIGRNFIWQAGVSTLGVPMLTNPVTTEVK